MSGTGAVSGTAVIMFEWNVRYSVYCACVWLCVLVCVWMCLCLPACVCCLCFALSNLIHLPLSARLSVYVDCAVCLSCVLSSQKPSLTYSWYLTNFLGLAHAS